MKLAINGDILNLPIRGASGPDGNPIGTIITYMGLTAPEDYLICDGSIYNIADYYALSQFFKAQFGAENYFGGDGTTTFAVPDMRNLFLRGYHGDSSSKLSDTIGKKQSATEVPSFQFYSGNKGVVIISSVNAGSIVPIRHQDGLTGNSLGTYVTAQGYSSGNISTLSGEITAITKDHYTTRPVNMAVLYCIKAKTAESYENIYSTEETRIGTWIDGKPLYRKILQGTLHAEENIIAVEDIDVLIYSFSCAINTQVDASYVLPDSRAFVIRKKTGISIYLLNNDYVGNGYLLIIEYTKTTDTAT